MPGMAAGGSRASLITGDIIDKYYVFRKVRIPLLPEQAYYAAQK